MGDVTDRLSQCRLSSSRSSVGRRPSTLSLGSCGSSRSSLSPASSSGRSIPSPTSNISSVYSSRSSISIETRRRSEKTSIGGPRPPSGRSSSQSVSSLMTSSEIKARIGNRATKTVSRPQKSCFACKKGIDEDAVFALGKLYHKQCLRCGYCGTRIDSKFFTRNGKPCCPKCSKVTKEKCKMCKLEIQGDWIEAGTDLFHPQCMRCYICGELSKDGFYTHQGMPVCKEHSMSLVPDCSRCGSKIVDSGYSKGEEILCGECMEDEVETCARCKKELKGESLGFNNVKFHKKCLYCVICRDNMVGKPVTMDADNNIYCSKDYDRKFAPTCHGCKKPIVPKQGQTKASRLRALEKDFHIACFKCQDCGVKLEGGGTPGKPCYPYMHLFLCRSCKHKREDESE